MRVSSSSGLIEGDDGKEYGFLHSDWRSRKKPKVGQRVSFDSLGSNAHEVSYLKSKSKDLPDLPDDEFSSSPSGTTIDENNLPLALRLPVLTVFGGIFGLGTLLGMFYAFAGRQPSWMFCGLLLLSTVGLAMSSGGLAKAKDNVIVPAFLAVVANVFAWLGSMGAILMALDIIYSGVSNPFLPPTP